MSRNWLEPSAHPVLRDDDAQVWLAHLPAARTALEDFRRTLSDDERARAEKFSQPEHRERWVITRGILRTLLARYLDADAAKIVFNYGAHGKPALPPSATVRLHFNTSHSGDHAAFAFTRLGEIGVDLEQVREPMPQRDDIARRFFARGEQRQLFALPESERTRAFFALWTRKESFVKARGTGVFSGLEQFEVALEEPRLLHVASEDAPAANWWMTTLPSVPGYEGAVVVRAPKCAARFWKWTG